MFLGVYAVCVVRWQVAPFFFIVSVLTNVAVEGKEVGPFPGMLWYCGVAHCNLSCNTPSVLLPPVATKGAPVGPLPTNMCMNRSAAAAAPGLPRAGDGRADRSRGGHRGGDWGYNEG